MITQAQREIITRLVLAPGDEQKRALRPELLASFDAADGSLLGAQLLHSAVQAQDGDAVDDAMVVCAQFGIASQAFADLVALALADWHEKHQDVAIQLATFRSPDAIEALWHLALWVPEYLEYDDSRALAVQAIYGLGAIDDQRAIAALNEIASVGGDVIRRAVANQLDR